TLTLLRAAPSQPVNDRVDGEKLLRQAWAFIKSDFYDRNLKGVDWDAALSRHLGPARRATSPVEAHEIVNHMLAELGASHTVVLERDAYAILNAELQGVDSIQVGCQLEKRDGGLFVRAVFERGPAERAGVRLGDRLVEIDGEAADLSENLLDAGHDVR